MNKRQKAQVSVAALCVVSIIIWLFCPGWEIAKILGILSGVLTIIALYISFRAEKKNNKNTGK